MPEPQSQVAFRRPGGNAVELRDPLGWRVFGWIYPAVWWARRKPRSHIRQTLWGWADHLDMRYRVMPKWRRL